MFGGGMYRPYLSGMINERDMTKEIEYMERQLLRIETVNGVYEIGRVTEKAIMLKMDDGRWGGNGYVALWVPKSILSYLRYDDRKECSQYGIHVVNIPDWFVYKNSKLW